MRDTGPDPRRSTPSPDPAVESDPIDEIIDEVLDAPEAVAVDVSLESDAGEWFSVSMPSSTLEASAMQQAPVPLSRRRESASEGRAADALDIELPTHLLDQGQIAAGGMGSIRRVFDKRILRHAALKVLSPKYPPGSDGALRFMEEARITGQLDHPNIVPVYDVGLDADGSPKFFTMKLVQGTTLTAIVKARAIAERSERELEKLLLIFTKVCDAVSFAHSRGVIHRDLKPDNIMIGTHGQVYVMDWGVARLAVGMRPSERLSDPGRIEQTAEPEGTIAGTAAFMAPEQAWGRVGEIDARTDVFGLGAILYMILTEVPPFRGRDSIDSVRRAQESDLRYPQDVVGAARRLPIGLCRIALKALAKSPDDRYQSVEALKQDAERFLRGGAWFAAVSFAPGETIVREGDTADAAYIITQGHCEAFKLENGRKTRLRTMGPGEVFGETAIFAAQARTASVAALDHVAVTVVTRESLEQELAGDSWAGALVRALAVRFRDLDGQLSALRNQVRIDQRIHDYVSFEGRLVARGHTEARWSQIAPRLCAELGLSEEEILEHVARSRDLSVDSARDVIALVNPLVG